MENKSSLTIVTGIYNMGRGELQNEFSRPYSHYLEKFKELLIVTNPYPIVVYCSKQDNEFILQYRSKETIEIINKELEEFKEWFEFYDEVQEVRKQPRWYNQADWLSKSPQATLEYYNVFVMSKMFMLNDITCYNPFKSSHFIWLDAALVNTVHSGYFSHDNILDKIIDYINPFLFLKFPYETGAEIHGFERVALNKLCKVDNVEFVCRGGLFGGNKKAIQSLNGKYYNLLKNTLNCGLMGTEESIFTALAYLFPSELKTFTLQAHGMISNFCESVKNNESQILEIIPPKPDFNNITSNNNIITSKINKLDIAFYILTFNSHKQLETTLKHLEDNQPEFLSMTKSKFCIDNSLDNQCIEENKNICRKYGLTILKEDNIGICGGRFKVAEHFERELKEEYYVFFEDDFMANPKTSELDKFGFQSYYNNILEKGLNIVKKENLDFLKFCFSEFYFDNGTQIAWYNVNQQVRAKFFPEQPEKLNDVPVPLTKFNQIKTLDGVPYALGEIYYCNWPSILTRKGSREIFLEPVFRFPHEAVKMSHAWEKMQLGKIKPGIILGTMFTHERFDFYQAERIECK